MLQGYLDLKYLNRFWNFMSSLDSLPVGIPKGLTGRL